MERRILVVEDNSDDEFLALRALRRLGLHNVLVVRDGEEALSCLVCAGLSSGEAVEPPWLVLLDLKLPKVDGMDVLQAVREQPSTKALPVIVISSSQEERDVRRCRELGVLSYITKPVESEKIADALRCAGLMTGDPA